VISPIAIATPNSAAVSSLKILTSSDWRLTENVSEVSGPSPRAPEDLDDLLLGLVQMIRRGRHDDRHVPLHSIDPAECLDRNDHDIIERPAERLALRLEHSDHGEPVCTEHDPRAERRFVGEQPLDHLGSHDRDLMRARALDRREKPALLELQRRRIEVLAGGALHAHRADPCVVKRDLGGGGRQRRDRGEVRCAVLERRDIRALDRRAIAVLPPIAADDPRATRHVHRVRSERRDLAGERGGESRDQPVDRHQRRDPDRDADRAEECAHPIRDDAAQRGHHRRRCFDTEPLHGATAAAPSVNSAAT
jgi:hypothetical protein